MSNPNTKNFTAVFQRLKNILTPYKRHLIVTSNTATRYNLVGISGKNQAKRFGGVAIRNNQVTFYSCPSLLQGGSQALKAKMSGTSSVSFTEIDEPLIQELKTLTAKRFKGYQDYGTF